MSNILKDTLNKQPLICAEGYLFEMERRGYLTSGEFVPEVALEHPEVLENLHKKFQHAFYLCLNFFIIFFPNITIGNVSCH